MRAQRTSRGVKMHEKMERVMHEYKSGTLRASSGQKVVSHSQAIAIGMSESGQARKKKKRRKQ